MTLRVRNLHFLLIGVLGLLAPAATARAQAIVVTARSASELADDLEYLIKSVAPDDDPMARAALDALEKFKAGAMIKGLDRGRGFGLAVTLPADFPGGGGSPTVVAAVPVSDFGEFLDSLKDLGLTVDDKPGVEGFSHKVSMGDGPVALFALHSRGHALFSLTADGADKLKALDPSSWWKKVRPATAMSVRIQLAEIPDALKDQFLNQLDLQAANQQEREPGEKEATFQGRIAGQDAMYKAFKQFVREGDAISLDFDVDRKASEIAVDLAITGRAGTDTAKGLRAFGEKRSRFQGLSPDAALAAWARVPIAKGFGEVISRQFEKDMERVRDKLDTEERKQLLTRFNDLLKSNLGAPEIDLGLAIRRAAPAGPGASHLVFISGMSLRDGRAVERLVRDAVEQIKPEDGVKVTFDIAKAADGTAIHQITGPFDKQDEKMAEHFGKPSFYFAFRGDALLIAFGEDSLSPLKRAVEGPSTPDASGWDGPVALVARAAPLGELAGENQEALRRAAAKVFKGEGAKRDRISLGIKGEGDGVHLRVAIDVPALKLFYSLGQEMQR